MITRSSAPAVEPLSEHKPQNQMHNIKNTTLKMILAQQRSL